MPVEWEEYRPVAGEAYSPGTEWFDSVTGDWDEKYVGPTTRHSKLLNHLKFRRPKQTAVFAETCRLKAAVKDLAEALKLLSRMVECKEDTWHFPFDVEEMAEKVLSDLS